MKSSSQSSSSPSHHHQKDAEHITNWLICCSCGSRLRVRTRQTPLLFVCFEAGGPVVEALLFNCCQMRGRRSWQAHLRRVPVQHMGGELCVTGEGIRSFGLQTILPESCCKGREEEWLHHSPEVPTSLLQPSLSVGGNIVPACRCFCRHVPACYGVEGARREERIGWHAGLRRHERARVFGLVVVLDSDTTANISFAYNTFGTEQPSEESAVEAGAEPEEGRREAALCKPDFGAVASGPWQASGDPCPSHEGILLLQRLLELWFGKEAQGHSGGNNPDSAGKVGDLA
jgi:hypothetical protein